MNLVVRFALFGMAFVFVVTVAGSWVGECELAVCEVDKRGNHISFIIKYL